jgi:hypothetical protein
MINVQPVPAEGDAEPAFELVCSVCGAREPLRADDPLVAQVLVFQVQHEHGPADLPDDPVDDGA